MSDNSFQMLPAPLREHYNKTGRRPENLTIFHWSMLSIIIRRYDGARDIWKDEQMDGKWKLIEKGIT